MSPDEKLPTIAEVLTDLEALTTHSQRRKWFLDNGYVDQPWRYTFTQVESLHRQYRNGESEYRELSEIPSVGDIDPSYHLVPSDMRVQVSVYAVERCYGGPEEGGWWYNWNTFHGISERVYPEQIPDAIERLKALMAPDQPRFDIYSCANDGPQFEFFVEAACGEHNSTVRPRYC